MCQGKVLIRIIPGHCMGRSGLLPRGSLLTGLQPVLPVPVPVPGREARRGAEPRSRGAGGCKPGTPAAAPRSSPRLRARRAGAVSAAPGPRCPGPGPSPGRPRSAVAGGPQVLGSRPRSGGRLPRPVTAPRPSQPGRSRGCGAGGPAFQPPGALQPSAHCTDGNAEAQPGGAPAGSSERSVPERANAKLR